MSALTRDRSDSAALADAAGERADAVPGRRGRRGVPMAFAFRHDRLSLSFLAAVVAVAALNYYTCALPIRAAALAHARAVAAGHAAAPGLQVVKALAKRTFGEAGAGCLSRVALVALLFGTNCGPPLLPSSPRLAEGRSAAWVPRPRLRR